ncbi:hypothetical protein CASFOL_010116 [Castilleja foliolosa]|uniref:Ankyrin repeat protein n=1 Tax=Castilleja foliolosa TaxID=1961234 RepID=A0ABD3DVT6_9LAMI
MFPYAPHGDEYQILLAAKTGNLELLQRLRNQAGGNEAFRRKCAFVEERGGFTCLHIAAERGYLQICRFLIEEVRIKVDFKTDKGDIPLLLAAINGHFRVAKYFIIRGADVEMGDYQGTTCLHIAAENENKEMMQLLLLRGADIEAHSVRGTPLQCAASRASVESVRFLLSRDADPNAVSPLSVSPLVGAILCSSYELLELLLQAGADPDQLSRGLSPLAVAAMKNDTRFLRSLLVARADPNIVTKELLFPIEYAAKMGNTEGLTILFPVTKKLSHYPNWSIRGIENHFHTESAKELDGRKHGTFEKGTLDAFIQLLDLLGKDEMSREDYSGAVESFSSAIYLQPDNPRFLSNRSKCWESLNEPHFALHDAEASVMLNPDRNSPFRLGAAWMHLKNYNKACSYFSMALMLDPENMQIKKAFSFTLKHAILGFAEWDLLKAVKILASRVPFCVTFYRRLGDLTESDPSEAMQVLTTFLDRPDLPNLL